MCARIYNKYTYKYSDIHIHTMNLEEIVSQLL